MTGILRDGGCACGAVRFTTRGEPDRIGLCHCLTCRKAHGSAFLPFAVFAAEQVEVTGDLADWESSPGYRRRFCPRCGSRVVNANGDEVEISITSFDDVGVFAPQYESWVIRREPWLPPLKVPQWSHNRGD
ncbi:GFA family protein [Phenylobacterium sp.]|uniref:GFA family protein n=1 Tax=Phenylobacterium sp. TaxID=1871053 RepID=UPI0035AEF1FF